MAVTNETKLTKHSLFAFASPPASQSALPALTRACTHSTSMVASYLIAAALPLAAALVADVRAPLSVQGRFRAPSMVDNPPASTDALNAPSTDVDSDSSSNGGLFNTLQMLRPRRQEPGDAEEVEERRSRSEERKNRAMAP